MEVLMSSFPVSVCLSLSLCLSLPLSVCLSLSVSLSPPLPLPLPSLPFPSLSPPLLPLSAQMKEVTESVAFSSSAVDTDLVFAQVQSNQG